MYIHIQVDFRLIHHLVQSHRVLIQQTIERGKNVGLHVSSLFPDTG